MPASRRPIAPTSASAAPSTMRANPTPTVRCCREPAAPFTTPAIAQRIAPMRPMHEFGAACTSDANCPNTPGHCSVVDPACMTAADCPTEGQCSNNGKPMPECGPVSRRARCLQHRRMPCFNNAQCPRRGHIARSCPATFARTTTPMPERRQDSARSTAVGVTSAAPQCPDVNGHCTVTNAACTVDANCPTVPARAISMPQLPGNGRLRPQRPMLGDQGGLSQTSPNARP